MEKQENRELIVSIQVQIERLPLSRLYRGLQVELDKLSRNALLDLAEMLGDVERWVDGTGPGPMTVQCACCGDRIKDVRVNQPVTEPELEEEIEDPCPECNGGEVYDGELDIMCCGRCDGTGTLS